MNLAYFNFGYNGLVGKVIGYNTPLAYINGRHRSKGTGQRSSMTSTGRTIIDGVRLIGLGSET